MRLLLTRLSSLGDVIHCWPLAVAIAASGIDLAWLVEEAYVPLVAPHPAVTRVIPVATRRWRRRAFARSTVAEILAARAAISAARCDVALDPQGLVKSAFWAALAGVGRRVGPAAPVRRERLAGLFYTETAPPPPYAHVIDLTLGLLAPLDVPVRPGAAPDGRFLLAVHDMPRADGPVALIPTAGDARKLWPVRSWIELARALGSRGLQPLVVWGPGERPLAERIATAGGATLAPPSPLPDLPRLLASCRAVVGGDTGPVHLSASLGVPTLALFLASDPARNGPRGDRVAVIGRAPAARAPRRSARTSPCAIAVERVIAELDTLLGGDRRA